MSGNELSPKFAAEMASNVYLIQDIDGQDLFKLKYKNDLDINDQSMIGGKTGAFTFLKRKQVIAVFSTGKGTYKGQAFVAIKGTANLYDALTDLNTGVKTSHTGCPVHQGFYYAFDSILTELRKFITSLKGIHTVHCVGHSLGGAIATLAADWIKASGAKATAKLYTFGSPRVGLDMFTKKCTSRLLTQNIYRVYHQTDPVPMVPTWPFYHVPNSAADYAVWSPVGVPWEYHRMKHYITSAEIAGSWGAMKKDRPKGFMDSTVESWLKSDGALLFTANTLELLSASFLYVLKKAVNAAGILMVGGFASTFTLLDRMAIFLARATKLSLEVSNWVYYLVRKMAALIGVKVKEGTNLTVVFIRNIFLRLHQKVSELVWRASDLR
jgi:triacylglycerol lipase